MNDPTLVQADEVISGPRQAVYGDATTEFARIAQVWTALLGHPVRPVDVPLLLIGMKLVRSSVSPEHDDSWVDVCGYAALAARVASQTLGDSHE